MSKYLLGVDGGNTKTDYLLCTLEGDFVDVYRTGSCSHEVVDGYDGMEQVMSNQLGELLKRNNASFADIAAAGLGLAGADLPSQEAELKKRVEKIGLKKYALSNDGILGIKGASNSGVGLCAVNGTGTVIVGIDESGNTLQVGGVGQISGDYAGGGHISRTFVALLYDFFYRCGEDCTIFPEMMELFNAKPEDLLAVVSDHDAIRKNMSKIIQLGARAACDGDIAAKVVFDDVGMSIGLSAAGCINNLSFKTDIIDIVLVGSIWHKTPYKGMQTVFKQTVEELSGRKCRCIVLKAPAAVGGVLWAKEIYEGKTVPADYRKKILDTITMDKYEESIKCQK